MGKIIKGIKSVWYTIWWKLRFGKTIQIGFPMGLEKVFLEKDRRAEIVLGERMQNRGSLYIGCREQGKLKIGSHCFFNTNTSITCMSRITIGDYCKFGNNLVIVDHDHNFRDNNSSGRSREAAEFVAGEIVIGSGVWIGADCVILKGVTIGDNAVVGAGSIVRKDIPAGVRYYEKRESIISEPDK